MTALLATAPPTFVDACEAPTLTVVPEPKEPKQTKRRPLRVRPVPGAERPLRTVRHVRVDEALPVDPPLTVARLVDLEPRDAREARADGESMTTEHLVDAVPLRSLSGPAADPGRVCASIVQVAAEAMRGLRPLAQLARWVDSAIFDELATFAPPHGARTSVRQRLAPDATASVLNRSRVVKIRVVRISRHVAECTVLVRAEERVRAVVVRLEEHGPTWRATALDAI